MSPYREAAPATATLEIGSQREFRLRIAGAVALLVASIVLVVVAAQTKEGGITWLPAPALIAALFLARARYCHIEVSRAEREVRVVVTRMGPTIRAKLAFDEVESVHTVPASLRSEKPTYVLQVGRQAGKSVDLLKAEMEAELREERLRVERFLIDAGAMPSPPVADPAVVPPVGPPGEDELRIAAVIAKLERPHH